jgi:hypothetical protein
MTKIGIILPIEQTDTLLNSSPALLGKGDGELDHVGRLGVAQLGGVSLISIDLQDVDRHVDRLLTDLLSHSDLVDMKSVYLICSSHRNVTNHRNSSHASDTILLLEVLCYRDLSGTVIWIGEGGLGSIQVDEFIDGPKV